MLSARTDTQNDTTYPTPDPPQPLVMAESPLSLSPNQPSSSLQLTSVPTTWQNKKIPSCHRPLPLVAQTCLDLSNKAARLAVQISYISSGLYIYIFIEASLYFCCLLCCCNSENVPVVVPIKEYLNLSWHLGHMVWGVAHVELFRPLFTTYTTEDIALVGIRAWPPVCHTLDTQRDTNTSNP